MSEVIPDGWIETTVGQHADVLTGFAFKSAEYTSNEQDVKLLRGDNVASQRLRWREVKRFPKDRSAEVSRYQLRAGDFVVAMDRTWLPTGVKIAEVAEADLPCLLVQRVARLRAKPSLHQGLMKQLFSGHHFDQYVQAVQTETAVPHISPADLRDYPIMLPPLAEQRRIAEMLSTWDRAIETIEALIANAGKRRDALLGTLLEQPDWPLRQLSAIGDITSAGVDKKSNEDERPVRLLNFVDVLRRDFLNGNSLTQWVTAPERQIRKCDVREGDVFFTPSSETRDDIAHSAVATEDISDAAYSYHVVRFRLSEPWPLHFRAYAFKSRAFLKQAQTLCAGSGQRYVLSQKQFGSIAIRVPPLEVQARIGGLLHVIDQERDLLTAQLGGLRQEKTALMQQLLTGKRRVKLNGVSAP